MYLPLPECLSRVLSERHRDASEYTKESVGYHGLSTAEEEDSNFYPDDACSKRRLLILNICILIINAIWSILNLTPASTQQNQPYTPAHQFLGTHVQQWDLSLDRLTEYTSAPGPAADEAWEKISMGGTVGFVRVQQDELDRIGETSVALADGSGQMVGLEVFHQLHCLNYLRKHLYNETYKIDPGSENVSAEDHIPHCIDSIRLALQCHADLSVIPFKWVPGYLEPWPDFRTNHVCRDFDAIRDWAEAKQPSLQGKLIHPQLGLVSDAVKLNASALPVHKGHIDFLGSSEHP